MPNWWDGPELVLFVDGAHDRPHWCMGGFSEQVGVRSTVAERMRSQSHEQSLAWGVRLASRLGYATVTLISDSEAAIARLLRVQAKSLLGARQKVLRGLVRSLMLSGLSVRLLWAPFVFQPADPLWRLQGGFVGEKMKAERMAWLIFKQLLRGTLVVEFRGVLCLGRGTAI